MAELCVVAATLGVVPALRGGTELFAAARDLLAVLGRVLLARLPQEPAGPAGAGPAGAAGAPRDTDADADTDTDTDTDADANGARLDAALRRFSAAATVGAGTPSKGGWNVLRWLGEETLRLRRSADAASPVRPLARPAALSSVDARLKTFERAEYAWPHEAPTPRELAKAGFCFRPSAARRDRTQCFACGYTHHSWTPSDQPLLLHEAREKSLVARRQRCLFMTELRFHAEPRDAGRFAALLRSEVEAWIASLSERLEGMRRWQEALQVERDVFETVPVPAQQERGGGGGLADACGVDAACFQLLDAAALQARGFFLAAGDPALPSAAGGAAPRDVVDAENDIPHFELRLLGRPHRTYVSQAAGKGPAALPCIISAESLDKTLRTPQPFLLAIVRAPGGDERIVLPNGKYANMFPTNKAVFATLLARLPAELRALRYTSVPAGAREELDKALVEYEQKLSMVLRYKFGVLLVRAGQSEDEFYANAASPAFETFLEHLGQRVALQGFEGYAGGLDTKLGSTGTHSVATTLLRRYAIMLHVSTMLPFSEQDPQQVERKRHIGNDIVVFVFLEGSEARFDPECLVSHFTQCVIVVQEMGSGKYRVEVAARPGVVPERAPSFPLPVPAADLRAVLLPLAVNWERAAMRSGALLALQRQARTRTLQHLISQGPKASSGRLGGFVADTRQRVARGGLHRRPSAQFPPPPLHRVCLAATAKTVAKLLVRGANRNMLSAEGENALHCACRHLDNEEGARIAKLLCSVDETYSAESLGSLLAQPRFVDGLTPPELALRFRNFAASREIAQASNRHCSRLVALAKGLARTRLLFRIFGFLGTRDTAAVALSCSELNRAVREYLRSAVVRISAAAVSSAFPPAGAVVHVQSLARGFLCRRRFRDLQATVAKRTALVQTLIAAETEYVAVLSLVEKSFVWPLLHDDAVIPWITPETVEMVFSKWTLLAKAHSSFLSDVRNRFETSSHLRIAVAPSFAALADAALDLYSVYGNDFLRASEMLSMLCAQDEFGRWVRSVELETGVRIDSVLVLPLSRLWDCAQFLDDLSANTWPWHPDYVSLWRVAARFHAVATSLINVRTAVRQRTRVDELTRMLEGAADRHPPTPPAGLAGRARSVLREGTLVLETPGDGNVLRTVVVFTDSFLVAQQRGPDKLRAHGWFPLEGMRFEASDDCTVLTLRAAADNAVTHVFFADSLDGVDWSHAFRSAMSACVRARAQRAAWRSALRSSAGAVVPLAAVTATVRSRKRDQRSVLHDIVARRESEKFALALEHLVDELHDPATGLSFRDEFERGAVHHSCFRGRELVSWLVCMGRAVTRKDAVETGRLLLSNFVIQQVSRRDEFEDSDLLYSFLQDAHYVEQVQQTWGRLLFGDDRDSDGYRARRAEVSASLVASLEKLVVEPLDEFNLSLLDNLRPAGWSAPTPAAEYNLVVIGGGVAGLSCAEAAASLGARVALVERHLLGGDSYNHTGVPAKALLSIARAAADARALPEGVSFSGGGSVEVDFPAVMRHMRQVRRDFAVRHSVRRLTTHFGIDVFLGEASFVGRHSVAVRDVELNFSKAVICAGGTPLVPDFEGSRAVPFLTDATLVNLTALPRRLLVLGGGHMGCEAGQAFRRFGSEVTIVEHGVHLLSSEDVAASLVIEARLREEGVVLLLGSEIKRAAIDPTTGMRFAEVLRAADSDTGSRSGSVVRVPFDEMLVCTGRGPDLSALQLDRARVRYDPLRGIEVNDKLQTSNPDVYAAGDVCTEHRFAAVAREHARIVVRNSLLKGGARFSTVTIPWCCFPVEDHQLLTSEGFMFHDEVVARRAQDATRGPLLLASYDPDAKQLVYEEPGGIVERDVAGQKMVEFTHHNDGDRAGAGTGTGALKTPKSNCTSIVATRLHDMYVSIGRVLVDRGGDVHKRTRYGRWPAYEKETAEALLGRDPNAAFKFLGNAANGVAVPPQADGDGDALPFVGALGLDSDEKIVVFLELCGFWLSRDGFMAYHRGSADDGVQFSQRKLSDKKFINARLQKLGVVRNTHYNKSTHDYHVTDPRWVGFFHTQHWQKAADEIRADRTFVAGSPDGHDLPPREHVKKSTKLFWYWVWHLKKDYARAVIRGLRQADGGDESAKSPTGGKIYTLSVCFRDELVQLCMHAGYSAYFTTLMCAKGERDAWAVCYSDHIQATEPIVRSGRDVREVDVGADKRYSGKAWCATMPHRFVVVRRARRDAATGAVVAASRPTIQGNCYTDPEVAHVGLHEQDLVERGIPYETYRRPFADCARAVLEEETDGFVSVFVRARTDEILGCTIVGRGAGELIGEVCFAIANKVGLQKFAGVLRPWPTRGELLKLVADDYTQRVYKPAISVLFRKVLRRRGIP